MSLLHCILIAVLRADVKKYTVVWLNGFVLLISTQKTIFAVLF